jgi:predicted nucleic acid-binding protein
VSLSIENVPVVDVVKRARAERSRGLPAYDATYLCLARPLRMPLVPLDKPLGAHASSV